MIRLLNQLNLNFHAMDLTKTIVHQLYTPVHHNLMGRCFQCLMRHFHHNRLKIDPIGIRNELKSIENLNTRKVINLHFWKSLNLTKTFAYSGNSVPL